MKKVPQVHVIDCTIVGRWNTELCVYIYPINFWSPCTLTPAVEEEVEVSLLHYEEESAKSTVDGKIYLPKFTPMQVFDGMMKNTKSFISSIILYKKFLRCEI